MVAELIISKVQPNDFTRSLKVIDQLLVQVSTIQIKLIVKEEATSFVEELGFTVGTTVRSE